MTQEQKDKLEQAAGDYGNRRVSREAADGFEAGAQTILENPEEWGLFTPDQMRGQRKHNHVSTWYESHIQKEKYREALEDVDRELAHEGFANSTGEGVDRARDIIKEVLKQEVNNDE